MFLVFVPNDLLGIERYCVFTREDPRKDGYKGLVEENVLFENDGDTASWPDGEGRPQRCVGRASPNPKQYKVFKYRSDLEQSDYEFLADKGEWTEKSRWSEVRLN